MTPAQVAAARLEVLTERRAAYSLLYTATKFGDLANIALARTQLQNLEVRENCLANIESLNTQIAALPA